jgi:hypothetical protein
LLNGALAHTVCAEPVGGVDLIASREAVEFMAAAAPERSK